MIDKSIPYIPLIMQKDDVGVYPRFFLPNGYEFVFYKDGDEEKWSKIQTAVGSFASVEVGTQVFLRDFVNGQALKASERVIFVRDSSGEYIASAALWDGDNYGRRLQRLHWIAVTDEHGGKGIAKAMICRLLDLYHELGLNDIIYLTTGTRNYPAIKIYEKFGFYVYDGEESLFPELDSAQFTERNKAAIELVNKMLNR
ncbi:MAG: GNAT family N-acetyltransferase [Clostridia bacterium]|nr:GNAT family N-acetyltransferase [Clostridia bacterium]